MKRFSLLITIRIAFIISIALLLAWIFGDRNLFFNQLILVSILIAQTVELIHFVNHTNRELARLLLAIKHNDFSMTFKQASLGKSFTELQQSMSQIVEGYKQVKIEKEVQFYTLQSLINQIHVGVIALQNKEDVVLINPTALSLINPGVTKSWKSIMQNNPVFAAEIETIGDNGKKLIELNADGEQKFLAVDVSTHIILDIPHTFITLQNINSEIEQKEIEAWHKLIRILTHEIMNSITPVSSLTETMQTMLQDSTGQQKTLADLTEETITDIRFSLSTIHKRNNALLEFVENYRKLARVPKPNVTTVFIKEFINEIALLMHAELVRNNIELTISISDEDQNFNFDKTLIEQVIINLITNSIHALQNTANKQITLKTNNNQGQFTIEVTDNGKGIPERELKEIFIPFFSTKKEGSGIGLSLCKQIMSLHGGSIRITSKPNIGTSLYLVFANKI